MSAKKPLFVSPIFIMASVGDCSGPKTRSFYAEIDGVPAAKKRKTGEGVSEDVEVEDRSTRCKPLHLYIPPHLTSKHLPYALHTNVTREHWQKSLENNESSSSKYMFYDESSGIVLITHLPTYEHEKTCHSLAKFIERTAAAYGIPDAQSLATTGGTTTLIGQEPDQGLTPCNISATQPPAAGLPGIPFPMDKRGRPYPTLVTEVRVYQSAPKLEQKINAWLGPNTTVQLLLKLIIRQFQANRAGPVQWRMEATLYRANANRANAPVVLQGPIEFGQVGKRRAVIQNPCNAAGIQQYILHLPMNLLYWGVPAAQVPNIGANWDLDLFTFQQLIIL